MHTKKHTLGVGIVALIVGFGVGYFMHSSPTSPAAGGFAARTSTGTYGGGMMRGTAGGGFLSGTVVKKDSGSLTVSTRDGNSHLVFLTPDTSVSKSVVGSVSDVSVGSAVLVSGTTNSDGSISANLVQLRPAPPTLPQAQ